MFKILGYKGYLSWLSVKIYLSKIFKNLFVVKSF